MSAEKHAWMLDVLRDMEVYAWKNDLSELVHLIATTRSTLVKLVEHKQRPGAETLESQWFEDLVDQLACVSQELGAVEARDRLLEARDAWDRHLEATRQPGQVIDFPPPR